MDGDTAKYNHYHDITRYLLADINFLNMIIKDWTLSNILTGAML